MVHPMYDNIFLRHDISIGKLSHPLHFNKYTQPICIPSSTDMTPDPGYFPTRPNSVDFAHTPSNALISTLQNFKKEFFKNMLKPDIRPLHFPPIFFTPLPFLVQGRNTLSLNADHFAPPPIPHPSYKVRIGKGRYLRICDSLENDPHGEILTPHHEFKPRKSCCSCFNSPPHSTHEKER